MAILQVERSGPYSGYRFLHGFQVKMRTLLQRCVFLTASELVLTGRLASIGPSRRAATGENRATCISTAGRLEIRQAIMRLFRTGRGSLLYAPFADIHPTGLRERFS